MSLLGDFFLGAVEGGLEKQSEILDEEARIAREVSLARVKADMELMYAEKAARMQHGLEGEFLETDIERARAKAIAEARIKEETAGEEYTSNQIAAEAARQKAVTAAEEEALSESEHREKQRNYGLGVARIQMSGRGRKEDKDRALASDLIGKLSEREYERFENYKDRIESLEDDETQVLEKLAELDRREIRNPEINKRYQDVLRKVRNDIKAVQQQANFFLENMAAAYEVEYTPLFGDPEKLDSNVLVELEVPEDFL